MNVNKLILALITCCFFILATGSVSGAEISINPGNGTIQDSIDSIADGTKGTIHLSNGNYSATKNVNVTYNNKNITIIGESKGNTILNGENVNWLLNVGENGRLTLINLTLINFLSSGNTSADAIIKNQGDNLRISNVLIKNSKPQVPIGNNSLRPAVVWNSGDNFLLENTRFENPGGYAGPGRTVYNEGDYFTTDNVTIINPNRYGLDNFGDYFTVKNSYLENTFPEAKSSWVCCPIQSDGNHVLITNTIVKNFPCCPISFGGNNITVSNITGINNSETVNFDASNVTIKDSYFETNRNSAITITGGENILIENNVFKNCLDSVINNAPSAAADSPGNNVTVINCVFESSNRAIKNAGSDFKVINSTFINNSGDYGAGIYNTGKNFLVEGSTFINNTADNGGAICQDAGSMNIRNSTFIKNTAIDGSAVIMENGVIDISNSQFIENNAKELGGTISVYGGKISTSKSAFIANKLPKGVNVFISVYNENQNTYSTNLKITKLTQTREKITVQTKLTETNTGNILKNQVVTLKIGTKTINAKTNSSGIAQFTYTITKNGKLNVLATSKDVKIGTTKYNKSSASSSIVVKPFTIVKQVTNKITKKGKYYTKTIQFKNTGTKTGTKTITVDLKKYKIVKTTFKNAKRVSLKNGKLTIKFTLPQYKSKKNLGTATITLLKK